MYLHLPTAKLRPAVLHLTTISVTASFLVHAIGCASRRMQFRSQKPFASHTTVLCYANSGIDANADSQTHIHSATTGRRILTHSHPAGDASENGGSLHHPPYAPAHAPVTTIAAAQLAASSLPTAATCFSHHPIIRIRIIPFLQHCPIILACQLHAMQPQLLGV